MGDWSLSQLDKVGTFGLSVLVIGLLRLFALILRGDLVTKREIDREILRGDDWQQRHDRAVELAGRAVDAGEKIADRQHPAKK